VSRDRRGPLNLALALALVAGLAAPRAARADTTRLGVVVTVEVNLAPGEAARIAEVVGRTLADAFVLDVIAGHEAIRRLPPGGVPEACLGEATCLADLGGRLAADQLLLLVAVKVGDRLQLDPTWVDVSRAKVVPRPSIELGAALAEVDRATLRDAAPRLLPDATPRPAAAAPTTTAPIVPPPARGRHMTRGAWIAAGIAGAGLVGGIGFGVAALARRSDLEDKGCGDTVGCPRGADGLAARALAADLCFAGAAIAGGVAGYLYWRSDRPAVAIEPRGDGAAVSLSGRW
jgi:hypothetical protein